MALLVAINSFCCVVQFLLLLLLLFCCASWFLSLCWFDSFYCWSTPLVNVGWFLLLLVLLVGFSCSTIQFLLLLALLVNFSYCRFVFLVVGWFFFWLLFKSSHCVDWFLLSLLDSFVVMISYSFVVVQLLLLLFCASKFKYLFYLAPMCVVRLFLGCSSVPFVIWVLLLLLVSLVFPHISSMQVWEWTIWIHHCVIFSSMIFKLCLIFCVFC